MHHAHIDKFAYQDSPVHRLDSRVKFLVVLLFTFVVLSVPRTSLSILTCYAVGPFTALVLAKIPLKFVLKQICLVSPFVLVLALTCPFYNRQPAEVEFGPFAWSVSIGWLRCFSILAKFIVTMMALIALVSTTRFSDLLSGLQKLGVPKILIVQLGFLYRYIFVLIDRAHQILRARTARKLKNLGFKTELKTASSMLGSLFIRSIDTAENINTAMHARGFDGNFRTISSLKFHRRDLIFSLVSVIFMLVLYLLSAEML
jgi:cobalt/nickel transport system permease protein